MRQSPYSSSPRSPNPPTIPPPQLPGRVPAVPLANGTGSLDKGLDGPSLRREAANLARDRQERTSTTHVLAVMAGRGGLCGQILAERRITAELVHKALRVAVDDDVKGEGPLEGRDPVDRLFVRAKDIASRTRRTTAHGSEVDSIHVLLAICLERGTAAHKTLGQIGVDIARLRGVLTQHLTGIVEPRRDMATTREVVRETSLTREGGPPSDRIAQASPRPLPTPRPITLAPLPKKELRPSGTRLTAATPVADVAEKAEDGASKALVSQEPSLPTDGDDPSGCAPETALASPIQEKLDVGSSGLGTQETRPAIRIAKRSVSTDKPTRSPGGRALVEPTRFDLDPKRAPTLAALGRNLSAMAARGELDPVIGRDVEIERALDVLAKRSANNPCLVGAPGVGKTAIAHGIARTLAQSSQAESRIVVELPISEILAGTGVRGALAERLSQIRKEVLLADGKIIVFLDEIHTLLGGDAGEEAASELKTALARGELPCIGATTPAEYRRSIDRDPALARRFTVVDIEELDETSSRSVIQVASEVLGRHHGLSYASDALDASVTWTARYQPARALPDKAISALDLAGARGKRKQRSHITREDLADVVAELADVPKSRLLESDAERFLALEEHLGKHVVGHQDALVRIARALRRGAAGLRGRRPLLSALLLGPTGVGKTETAKAIAKVLFHDESAMTRLDLSEYAEAHAVARLVGAPPGYVGHDEGGQLTEAVRRRPYQVILFDEMEKAHRDVLEALLQLLDEGRMTDGKGRTIDFTNTVVILTSNLGVDALRDRPARKLGFSRRPENEAGTDSQNDALELDNRVLEAARAQLPPELYNRFDEVIVYRALTRQDALAIARLALQKLAADLQKQRSVGLQVDDDALELLLNEGGFDPSLGGRPIRREISRKIEAPLAELLLRAEVKPGDTVWVACLEGQVVVDLVTP